MSENNPLGDSEPDDGGWRLQQSRSRGRNLQNSSGPGDKPGPSKSSGTNRPSMDPETRDELAKFRKNLQQAQEEVNRFKGSTDSMEHKLLKERLVAMLCELDGIEDGGELSVREIKRDINRSITKTLSTLDQRAMGDKGKQVRATVDAGKKPPAWNQGKKPHTMGGEGKQSTSASGSREPSSSDAMDVDPPQPAAQPAPKHGNSAQPMSRKPESQKRENTRGWENIIQDPVQLLVQGSHREIILNEQALRDVMWQPEVRDRRVAILSVVGAPREDRLTLFNLAVGHLEAQGDAKSAVAPEGFLNLTGHQRGGIQLWPKPYIINDIAVFLLNCESLEVTNLVCVQLLMTLTSMISSVVVFNVNDTLLLNTTIHALKFMHELGLLLAGETGDKALHKLVVVMQPHSSEMGNATLDAKNYGLIGGAHQLQRYTQGFYSDQMMQQLLQQLMYTALACYEQIENCLLPFSHNPDQEPLFVRLAGEMVERLLRLDRLTALRVAGREVRAHELPPLMSALVRQLQQPGAKPLDIVNAIAGVEQERALRLALESYDQEVTARMPELHSAQQLLAMHQEACKSALHSFEGLSKFGSNAVMTAGNREILEKGLRSKWEQWVRPFMAQREQQRKERVKEEVEVACADHQRALSQTKSWDVARPLQAIHEEITTRIMTDFLKNVGHLLQEEEKIKYTAKLERKTRAVFMVTKRDYDPWRIEEARKQASTLYREVMEAALGTDAFATAHTEAWEQAANRLTQLMGDEKKSRDALVALLVADVGKLRTELQSTHEQYLQRAQDERTARAASLEQAQRQAPARYRQLMADAMPGLQTVQEFEEAHENYLEIAMSMFEELRMQVDEQEMFAPYATAANQAISVNYNILRDDFIKSTLEQEVTKCVGVYESTMDSFLRESNMSQKVLEEAHALTRDRLLRGIFDPYEHDLGVDVSPHKEKATKLMDDKAVMLYAALESKTLERGFLAQLAEFTSAMEKLDLASCSRETLKKTYQAAREKTLQGIQEKLKDKPNLESRLLEADQAMTVALNTMTAELQKANLEGLAYEDALAAYTAQMQEVLEWGDSPPTNEERQAIHKEAYKNAQQIFKQGTEEKGSNNVKKFRKYSTKLEEDIGLAHEKISTDFAMLVRQKRLDSRSTLGRLYDRFRGKNAEYAIGIDLGTTNSCVMVYKKGKMVPILNENKKPTTPSVVYFDQHETCVGEKAKFKGFADPANCISEVKRIIGRTYDDQVVQAQKKSMAYNIANMGGQPQIQVSQGAKRGWFPEEVSTELLKELKYQAGVQLGCEVHDAVVTIPAYFTEPQRDATLRACKEAGLNVLRLLNEPTAAAMAYGLQALGDEEEEMDDENLMVLVFDFGGGTCDVSIMQMRGGNFVVKASRGDNKLGGEDYDDRLADHFAQQLEKDNPGLVLDPPALRRLRNMAEIAKCRLTDASEYNMHLVNFVGDFDLDEVVTRSLLERLTKDLTDRALVPVKDCLQDAGLGPQHIDVIVLAGGSSRIPKVKQLLSEFFRGKALYNKINPDEAIAYGAAVQAALLTGECKRAIKVQDITPFSLGVEVVGERLSIIIKKNSQIPCEMTERYHTVHDNQTAADISVYQGEDTQNVHNNTKLGEFTLSGLRCAPAGQVKLDETFKIDENGILHVTAVEVGTELKNQKSVTIKKKVNM